MTLKPCRGRAKRLSPADVGYTTRSARDARNANESKPTLSLLASLPPSGHVTAAEQNGMYLLGLNVEIWKGVSNEVRRSLLQNPCKESVHSSLNVIAIQDKDPGNKNCEQTVVPLNNELMRHQHHDHAAQAAKVQQSTWRSVLQQLRFDILLTLTHPWKSSK